VSADLLVVVPSRGRPANIAELLEAWRATNASADLLVAADEDDPQLPTYRALDWGCRALLTTGPRLRLGPTLNAIALEQARRYFAVGFLGDDHRPRTQDWDKRFVGALRELRTGLAYGDDLLQGENLPTAVAMTSDIIRTLGYMVPPGMVHMYIDNAWLALGRELGRITYLPDVVIEHLHPVAGKAAWDDGYAEVNSPQMYARDRQVFDQWLEESLPVEIPRLRKLLR
jgi:hypothetical protein